MKESIYTIPISEALEQGEGCPLCRIHGALEERWQGYITGAAMMEPDVRAATNREGFCRRHLEEMLRDRSRLAVALMLQSRLEYLEEEIRAPGSKSMGEEPSCFLCARVEGELVRLGKNLAVTWQREESLRALWGRQERLCLPHFLLLRDRCAPAIRRGGDRRAFVESCRELALRGYHPVKENLDAFCRLFDYRNAGNPRPEPQVAEAPERAGAFLCSDK